MKSGREGETDKTRSAGWVDRTKTKKERQQSLHLFSSATLGKQKTLQIRLAADKMN